MRSDYIASPPSPLASIIAAMADPCFELDTAEAAQVFSAFATARAAGHWFDPFTVALVTVLRRQLSETDAGFEDDLDVADFENEDPYEDADDECEDGEFSSLEPHTYHPLVLTKARIA